MDALSGIPPRILDFQQVGEDRELPESVRRNLETNTILMRDYIAPSGRPVQLTIVFAERTRRSLHFPEVCFTGQGWETHGKSMVPIGLAFVGQGLTIQNGDARQAVIYWFKTGDHSTASYLENTLNWSLDKLTFKNPSSMLIRVSTPIGTDGPDLAYQVLTDFAAGLAPILDEKTF